MPLTAGSQQKDYHALTGSEPDADWWISPQDANEGNAANAVIATQLSDLYKSAYKAATEKTVSSGVLTVDQNSHTVQPETGTSDDINTISGMKADTFLVLYMTDEGTDTGTFKHGTGNLSCFGAADVALSHGMIVCYYDGSVVYVAGGVSLKYPLGYFYGFSLSNAADTAHDILIAVGVARDSTNASDLTGSALTKQIDAGWSVGNNAGGLDTGSVANSTWYHIFAILKDSDNTVDYLFSASASSPTMPGGYTKFRISGSVLTDGSANIFGFTQVGNQVIWDVYKTDASTTVGTSASLITLSTPGGYETIATINVQIPNTASGAISVWPPQKSDQSVSTSYSATVSDVLLSDGTRQAKMVLTNASSQVRIKASVDGESFAIHTYGWQYLRENM